MPRRCSRRFAPCDPAAERTGGKLLSNDGTVIVTGASAGLGAALVRVFAGAGRTVVAAARSAERLADLAAGAEPGRVVPVATDVSDPGQVAAMIDRATARGGRIDALINNAGIDKPGPIEELEIADWDRIIGVNLSGAFYACKAVFPIMKRQGGGTIVNVSSVAGRRGAPGATAYCASKFGMTGLTQALQAEGKAHDIRCSIVYPGGMDTGWTGEPRPDFLAPDDVARFVLTMVDQPNRFAVNEVVLGPVDEQFYP